MEKGVLKNVEIDWLLLKFVFTLVKVACERHFDV